MTHAVIIWSWHQLPGLQFFSSAQGEGEAAKTAVEKSRLKKKTKHFHKRSWEFCCFQLLCKPRTNETRAEELCSTRRNHEFLFAFKIFTWCCYCAVKDVCFPPKSKRVLVGRKNQQHKIGVIIDRSGGQIHSLPQTSFVLWEIPLTPFISRL